uniref:Uncharacterized protein n=1 Tax=Eutreptiella gymnastica TaxID=73025 RepID=A0A7S1J154_9EUGL|mmetsp:Transcript_5757/g.10290  ORF Transcript_5757/g.10290 Transcript_5757/m.10290 type:complete len:112 (+) Transcript_5757:142-477(+)
MLCKWPTATNADCSDDELDGESKCSDDSTDEESKKQSMANMTKVLKIDVITNAATNLVHTRRKLVMTLKLQQFLDHMPALPCALHPVRALLCVLLSFPLLLAEEKQSTHWV